MSFHYDDSLIDFDLDFLHQTPNTATTPDRNRNERCRKAISIAKKKIIATDGLIKKYYEKREELEQLEKVLYSSKEECKKVCIDFRNVTEKCTQLENEAQCLRTTNQELQEKSSKTANLVSAIQSHANQLQTLVKQNETVIEGLKVENQLERATIKDYEKKTTSYQKENKTLMKHICLMKEIILGKRTLNKNDKAVLEKYDKSYESDDNDSLLEGMYSDDETDMDSHFKSPLISKAIANKVDISLRKASKEDLIVMKYDNDLDSDFSNEPASADTGRGSSLAFSDGEKCLHSPDYFMDSSPINTEFTNKNIRNRVDVATSPIPSCQLVHTATSPIPAKQAAHIASPIAYKAKETILIVEPKNKTTGVIYHVPSKDDLIHNGVEEELRGPGKNQKNIKKHKRDSKNKSNMSSTSTENASNNSLSCNEKNNIDSMTRVSSPIELDNEILSPESHLICSETIDEKECLELNNSDTLNSKNNKDGEIEMILSKMRFNRDLITPIPSSPFKSRNSAMQNQEFVSKDVLKKQEEQDKWKRQVDELEKRFNVFEKCLISNNLLPPRPLKNRHNSMIESDYSENDPILISENVRKNVQHEINSFERSSSKMITEEKVQVQQDASSISNNYDMNRSIKRLQFEEPLPPILNDVSSLDESVDKHANENTDEEECYEEDIFHFDSFNNNMQTTKRHKQRKLTKLDRFKQKIIPKNKIKPISSPKRKLPMKHLMLSKAKAAASIEAAVLSKKIAYEKAVKVMSELKTQQKSKEIILNTHKRRDKQICNKASKMSTGIPKVRSSTTKELLDIESTTTERTFEMDNANDTTSTSENDLFKMQDSKDTVNTTSRDHTMKIQDAKTTGNTTPLGLHLHIQEKLITEQKKANQIIILENILITDLKKCTDNKVLKKPKQVKPSNSNTPEIKVIQKPDTIGLLLHENFDTKSSKEKEPFTTINAFDSPSLGVNNNTETTIVIQGTRKGQRRHENLDTKFSKEKEPFTTINAKEPFTTISAFNSPSLGVNNNTETAIIIQGTRKGQRRHENPDTKSSKEKEPFTTINAFDSPSLGVNNNTETTIITQGTRKGQRRHENLDTKSSKEKDPFTTINAKEPFTTINAFDSPSLGVNNYTETAIIIQGTRKGQRIHENLDTKSSKEKDPFTTINAKEPFTPINEFDSPSLGVNNNTETTIIIQGTRKRQKRTSLEKPDVECKRILRSSTLRRTSIQENTKETSSNVDDILFSVDRVKSVALNSPKEKSKCFNPKTEELQKVQQNTVSYSDIDLFNDNTESNQHIDEGVGKRSCLNPKESILCEMLEKYGRQSVKTFSKKVSDSVVSTICKTIENEISDIIQSSPKDSKQSMNKFVETIKKLDCKQFMAGLMQYLKDPQRKIELFSKVCTPPAPPMTKSEQILLFLVTQLRRAWPSVDIVDCVLCNMEYTLFKLNRTPEFETVESMSHLYAIMCRYFKLKSRLRLFMLDAMYCIQFKSVPLIKQCMEVWMHVLPLAHMGIAKSPLVTCMVYLLHFYKCDDKFNRVQDIRHILNRKYFYQITEWNEPKIIEMFRNAIKDVKVIPVEMKLLRIALIVIAKRHGPKWCQKNIVKNLLIPIIENDSYSERVKVFCVSMLGPLLKPYPVDMRVHCEIVMNMLLDMLNHNLTPKMEEAIYSSLIFMSRHNYNRVVQALLSWKPKQISPHFENVIRDFVGEKPLRVWRAILLKITLA